MGLMAWLALVAHFDPWISRARADLAAKLREHFAHPLLGSPRISHWAGPAARLREGLADLAEGRVKDFDTRSIVERRRKLLARRSPSA
jgi:hypothetical protein